MRKTDSKRIFFITICRLSLCLQGSLLAATPYPQWFQRRQGSGKSLFSPFKENGRTYSMALNVFWKLGWETVWWYKITQGPFHTLECDEEKVLRNLMHRFKFWLHLDLAAWPWAKHPVAQDLSSPICLVGMMSRISDTVCAKWLARCLAQTESSLSDNLLWIFNQKKWTSIQKLKKEEDTGGTHNGEIFHLDFCRIKKKNRKGVWLREDIWVRAEGLVQLSGGCWCLCTLKVQSKELLGWGKGNRGSWMRGGFLTSRMHGGLHTAPLTACQPSPVLVAGRRKEREKKTRVVGQREEKAMWKGKEDAWEWLALQRAGSTENWAHGCPCSGLLHEWDQLGLLRAYCVHPHVRCWGRRESMRRSMWIEKWTYPSALDWITSLRIHVHQ